MVSLWNNLSLRLRLTLLYVGLLALLFCILSGILYWDTHRFLLNSTATRLRAQAKPVIERWLYQTDSSLSSPELHPLLPLPSPEPPPHPPLPPFSSRPPLAPSPLELADLSRIADTLARDLTSRDTVALILDRDGQVLANGRMLPEEPLSPSPNSTYYSRALAGENEVSYITTVSGQRTLVVLIPLRRAPGSPEILGVVQLSTPLTSVNQVLLRQRLLLGIGIGLTLLVGTICGLWLTTSALRPLNRMVITCRRIAAGDLSQRVNLPHRQDEIGQLASAFNNMVARIEAAFEAQRRFVADAAHELRTPLTALQGSLEVLLRGSQDDPAAVARLTQGMYREVTRLARLCEQLLDLTRINTSAPIHKEPVELQAFFNEFIQLARLLARERNVVLEAGPSITVPADSDALRQVLFNLVDNAVQHTERGGSIALGWRISPGEVEIWVADDGEGIAPEDLPHIFEAFYRGDRSHSRRRGGTGLGLTLARALIEAHGGRIEVDSQVGEGTRFTIALPLS